jgi:hypothetical protein
MGAALAVIVAAKATPTNIKKLLINYLFAVISMKYWLVGKKPA